MDKIIIFIKASFSKFTIFWLLMIAVTIISFTNQHFAKLANIQSVLLQASYVGISAIGMTLLIIIGDFDLSIGSMLALCSIATASSVSAFGPISGVFAATAAGMCLGLFNGLIVTKFKIPTLVATLGTMYVFIAFAYIIIGDSFKSVSDPRFLKIAFAKFLFLPISFWIMVVVMVLGAFLLNRTNYGRMVRASGTNRKAAFAAGLSVDRLRIATFVVLGFTVGVTSFLQTAQLSSASPTMGTGFELNVIATVILGGASLKGGRGSIFGTFCSAIFFAVMSNALNLYGVDSYWQYVVVGTIIVLALAFDSARQRYFHQSR
jgi:ribose transport system permease protein